MTRWSGAAVAAARKRWAPAVAQGYPCGFCGQPIYPGQPWDVDHILPRSMGGTSDPSNTRPTHSRCNRGAGGRMAAARRQEAKPTLPPETQEGIRGL